MIYFVAISHISCGYVNSAAKNKEKHAAGRMPLARSRMKSAGATRARGRAGGVSRAFDLRGTLVPGDPREISGAEVTASFDGLNRDIIVMLQEDGRRSFATIARKLGVSEGTVRARVRQMRHDKLLRFVAVVNPVALGYSAWAMLGIKLAPGVSPERIAKRSCARIPMSFGAFWMSIATARPRSRPWSR
jgi:hypothetical protein